MNPYADSATGVPHNKLAITDRAELAKVEYAITAVRIAQLQLRPIDGNFDLDHLRRVHKHVFQDVYDWAGKERTLNFSKVDPAEPWWKSVFARHEQIPAIAQSLAEDLKAWNHLKGLGQAEFLTKLAAVYVKVNHMHPFPEGNGRSTQAFLSQLALQAGYTLDFAKIGAEDWNTAAARSMPQVNGREPAMKRQEDVRLIQRIFQQIVAPTRVKQPENVVRRSITPFRSREPGGDR